MKKTESSTKSIKILFEDENGMIREETTIISLDGSIKTTVIYKYTDGSTLRTEIFDKHLGYQIKVFHSDLELGFRKIGSTARLTINGIIIDDSHQEAHLVAETTGDGATQHHD